MMYDDIRPLSWIANGEFVLSIQLDELAFALSEMLMTMAMAHAAGLAPVAELSGANTFPATASARLEALEVREDPEETAMITTTGPVADGRYRLG